MKKFNKKELMNRLEMSEEKAKLIMKAQHEFPELLTNNYGTIDSCRDLYFKLGLSETHWSKWYKKNIIGNEFFLQNKDWFEVLAPSAKTSDTNGLGGRPTKDFKVTIEFAKHLCMMAKTEKAHEIRNYFIYLEEAIKDMTKWYEARNPQIKSYKEMCNIIDKQYIKNHDGKKASPFVYSNNADMLNLAMVQLKSKQIKEVLNIGRHDSLRDNLVYEFNKALDELQVLNGNLVLSNIDFATRKMIIENTCREKYSSIRVRFVSEFHKEIEIVKKTIK